MFVFLVTEGSDLPGARPLTIEIFFVHIYLGCLDAGCCFGILPSDVRVLNITVTEYGYISLW